MRGSLSYFAVYNGCTGKGLLYKPSQKLTVESSSDADWTGNRRDKRSTSGYCTFVGGILVTWRSKKQTVVARSSAETKYCTMAHISSEMMWVWSLLYEMWVIVTILMKMYCDNQSTIFIPSNPVFHKRIKHIEVDCHFIRDLVIKKYIVTPYVQSENQLGDILTKLLARSSFSVFSKLGLFNSYAST